MKINFTETVIRDANQSLMATRMKTSDFEQALGLMDNAGYNSIECWGGATFDSCLRFLDEDPWERLRKIKKAMPKTPLQMLFRGQNILGYRPYPDDIVRMFVRKSKENGIDIIRVFDALNDVRNLKVAIAECVKVGAHAQGAICYTISPVHTIEMYAKLAKQLDEMGAQSICIKDMSGIMTPKEGYDTVKAMREVTKLPIQIHTHCTTGLAQMTLLKCIEAGATGVDTAISCFSGGTSQPATETQAYIFAQYGYDTGLNFKKLLEINEFFRPIQAKYVKAGTLNPMVYNTEPETLVNQIPGGMLSNLISQLTQQNALDKLPLVLEETPKVRADLGYPPLVTPTSQMVGAQATSNVLLGGRYKSISKEVKSYIRGEYGQTPAPINPDLIKQALGDEKQITSRFADSLGDEFEKIKAQLGAKARNDEDVLSYIAFPQVAEDFFKKREQNEKNTAKYSIKEIK